MEVYIFCINGISGGAGRRQVELLNHLSKKKQRTYLISYTDKNLEKLKNLESVTICAIPPIIRNVFYFSFFSFFCALYIILKNYQKQLKGFSYAGNAGVSLAGLKLFFPNKISIYTFLRGAELQRTKIRSEEIYKHNFLKNIHVLFHKLLMSFLLKQSNFLITQSKVGFTSLKNDYSKYIPDNYSILPNNINSEWIQENVRNLMEEDVSIPKQANGCFKICWVGRANMYVKGLDIIIRVIENLNDLPIHAFVVGDGKDLEKAKQQVVEKEIVNKITFFGYLDNPLKVLEKADLLIVPSRSDPFPNVIFESMVINKPVLGADVDGIPEILKYDELLFLPDKEGCLEGKVKKAMECSKYLKKLKNFTMERAENFKFNWSKKFLEILTEG